ncbi:hypothetical protein WM32_05535 [Burkholderia ubonensis]|nr:hypothetical protein WM32_05535 [Burkholderia ubonensis]
MAGVPAPIGAHGTCQVQRNGTRGQGSGLFRRGVGDAAVFLWARPRRRARADVAHMRTCFLL